jgi:hypothetical protein
VRGLPTGERDRVRGAHGRLRFDLWQVRGMHGGQPVHERGGTDLRQDEARLRRLLGGSAMPDEERRAPGVPSGRPMRSVHGRHGDHRVHRRDLGVRHDDQHLRAVHFGRDLFGLDAHLRSG